MGVRRKAKGRRKKMCEKLKKYPKAYRKEVFDYVAADRPVFKYKAYKEVYKVMSSL